MNDPTMFYGSMGIFLFGVFAVIFVKYRNFKRTNEYGVQEFGGFFSMLLIGILELLLVFVGWPAIFFGGFLMLVYRGSF